MLTLSLNNNFMLLPPLPRTDKNHNSHNPKRPLLVKHKHVAFWGVFYKQLMLSFFFFWENSLIMVQQWPLTQYLQIKQFWYSWRHFKCTSFRIFNTWMYYILMVTHLNDLKSWVAAPGGHTAPSIQPDKTKLTGQLIWHHYPEPSLVNLKNDILLEIIKKWHFILFSNCRAVFLRT